jgi:hypothetical protein
MNANRLFGAVLSVGLCLGAATHASDAMADKPKAGKKDAAAPAPPADPPDTKKAVVMPLSGLTWGMSQKQVVEAIDKVLDEAYKPLYAKVSPGVKMKALDAALAEDKDMFRRSRIDFGKLPTGVDATPLKGEYTYNNREFMLELTREGASKHFFFIQDKLWKIIDDVKLSDKSVLGTNYQEAVMKLATTYGVVGRVLPPDYEKGRSALEVDWKDPNTHLRAIQRSDTAMSLAYEDNATLAALATLRTAKDEKDDGVDPSVAAIMRKGDDKGPPPKADDNKKNDGKKGGKR